jgi:hypothetical protein
MEYTLTVLCSMISYIFNYHSQRIQTHSSNALVDILLNKDLAIYLSRILRIEKELFDRHVGTNSHGL